MQDLIALTTQGFLNKYRYIIHEGGTRCFNPSQLVITKRGSIQISRVRIGDECLSFNEKTHTNEWKRVLKVNRFKNSKKTIRILQRKTVAFRSKKQNVTIYLLPLTFYHLPKITFYLLPFT